jgi:tetratricopeptide (TPR) repeat protein
MAYLRELRGDYAYARREFRRLNAEANPFDPSSRAHRRARLYQADMLTMDGELAEANLILAEASELLDSSVSLDRAEMIRHRGHAYRFSLEYRAAEERYAVALEASGRSPSMRGKLRTNLAESRCWHAPARGLTDADDAIELNTRLGSRIEVAKAQAARGVALALLGNFDEAKAACDAAFETAKAVDYPAALCFAGQALVVLEMWAGRPARADEAYEALIADIDALGTYGHLAVIPAWVRGDDAEFRRRSGDVSWISGRPPEAMLTLIRPDR